ncbi:hypothetical protein HYW76_03565 [Candidatus Pacearchaeota archaeon]|nr:hypothetical protein [Candidatus Pacearchaeota archaeon]
MLRETDYIQERVNYIKKNLKKGYTADSLKWALVSQGYPRSEVERAMKLANEQLAKEIPILEERPKITLESQPLTLPSEKKGFFSKIKFWLFG